MHVGELDGGGPLLVHEREHLDREQALLAELEDLTGDIPRFLDILDERAAAFVGGFQRAGAHADDEAPDVEQERDDEHRGAQARGVPEDHVQALLLPALGEEVAVADIRVVQALLGDGEGAVAFALQDERAFDERPGEGALDGLDGDIGREAGPGGGFLREAGLIGVGEFGDRDRGGEFFAGLPGQRGQAVFAAVHDHAVTGGPVAAQREEFRDDLAVFRPREAFFRGEAAAMRGVGEHLLAVGRGDEPDEHLLEREGRDGLEREVHLARQVFAFDREAAHEEAVAGQHGGVLGVGALEHALEGSGHLVGGGGAAGSEFSARGFGSGGAPLSSSQARTWKG